MPAGYSHTTRASGIVLTATIYNDDHVNHITNGVPLQLDDYSTDVTEMRVTADPGEAGTESLATTLGGELARIRFTIKEMKKWLNGAVDVAQWYTSASGSVAGTVADGAITNAKLRDSTGCTVIGRAANSVGAPADISANADTDVLRRSGGVLGFGTISTSYITGLGTAALKNTGTSGNTVPLLDAQNTWSARQIFGSAISVQNVVSPTALSGNVNDYNPTSFGNSNVLRITATGATRDITGFDASVVSFGELKRVINIGTEAVRLLHENAGSSATNRILNPNNATITLMTNESCEIWYDSTSSRWRVLT